MTIDERGQGQTTSATPFDYWDVATDVITVLDHLGVPAATIAAPARVASSRCGWALLRPELVTGLVLMGTSGEAEDPPVAEAYRAPMATWNDQGPVDAVIEPLASICPGDFEGAEAWKQRWRDIPEHT